MTIYENNLEALKKRNQDLYEFVKTMEQEEERDSCSLVMSKNNQPLISIQINGGTYILGSRYNPDVEAERFAKQYAQVTDGAHMSFLGFGSGVIPRKIVEQTKPHIHYLFYEPSADIFLFAMKQYDLTDLFLNTRLDVVVKGCKEKHLDAVLAQHVTVSNYQFCTFDALPTYRKLFESDFEKMRQDYVYIVEMVKSNIMTAIHFAESKVKNEIYNLKEVFHCNCQEDFEGCFPTDRPAIVVAAGPSLEKNAHLLKEAKGKFFIIAVDSALRYLVSQDIKPDLAIVADPRKPVVLFENEKVQQIPLAIYGEANHDIVKLMKKQKIIVVSSESAYYNKLFELAGKHMYTLNGGGSVATYAFMLALSWGYKKVVLLGQDLALGTDKVHAGKDDIDTFKLQGKKIEIEGYYGDTIYTSPDYDYYRKWYEMAIRRLEDIEVINCTEGGAKIQGATQKSFREVLDEYDVEPFDFEGCIIEKPYTFGGELIPKIQSFMKQSVRNCDNIKRILKQGIRNADRGALLIRENRYTIPDIKKLRKSLAEDAKKIDAYEEIYYLNTYTEKDFGFVLEDLLVAKDDDMEECCRIFEKMSAYMGALYAVADDVKAMFTEVYEAISPEEQV